MLLPRVHSPWGSNGYGRGGGASSPGALTQEPQSLTRAAPPCPVDSSQGSLPPGLTGWREALVVGKGTVASTHIYQLN